MKKMDQCKSDSESKKVRMPKETLSPVGGMGKIPQKPVKERAPKLG